MSYLRSSFLTPGCGDSLLRFLQGRCNTSSCIYVIGPFSVNFLIWCELGVRFHPIHVSIWLSQYHLSTSFPRVTRAPLSKLDRREQEGSFLNSPFCSIHLHVCPHAMPLGLVSRSFIVSFLKVLFSFRDRGRGGVREGGKHQPTASHMCPQLGTRPAIQACAPSGNQPATFGFAGRRPVH